MSFLTHKFNDDLGGRYVYKDEPGRLEELLAKRPIQGTRKAPSNSGEEGLKQQVAWYVKHVQKTPRESVLNFFDKGTYANDFQNRVLKGLGFGERAYWFTCKTVTRQNQEMREQAEKAGWTINIVPVSELKL